MSSDNARYVCQPDTLSIPHLQTKVKYVSTLWSNSQGRFFLPTLKHWDSKTDNSLDGPPDSQHPKVIYIPGEHCVHPNGDMVEVGKQQLRISYGFEELPQIHAALKYMKSAIAYSQENL